MTGNWYAKWENVFRAKGMLAKMEYFLLSYTTSRYKLILDFFPLHHSTRAVRYAVFSSHETKSTSTQIQWHSGTHMHARTLTHTTCSIDQKQRKVVEVDGIEWGKMTGNGKNREKKKAETAKPASTLLFEKYFFSRLHTQCLSPLAPSERSTYTRTDACMEQIRKRTDRRTPSRPEHSAQMPTAANGRRSRQRKFNVFA